MIRRTTLVALALLVSGTAAAADAATDGMPWETSYATAIKKSEEGGKPLLLDFYTGWCPHCTRMDKTTWKDADLIRLASSGFVVAKINADVEKVPVTRYHLVGYPTMIVAHPGGDQAFRLEGYVDAAGMTRALTAYQAHGKAMREAGTTLASDKKNVAAQLVLADGQAAAGMHAQAADSYKKIAKTATGDDLARASAGAGLALSRAGKADEGSKILAKALQAAGDKPSPALMLAMGENEKALGRADKAKEWFARVVQEHPASPEATTAKVALGS